MKKYFITYEYESRRWHTTVFEQSKEKALAKFFKNHSKKCEIISAKEI